MSDFLYRYPTLYPGTLLKRYKRFFADVELLSGEVVTAHCPNTGPMTCISTPGSLVQLSQTDKADRKLRYTWEMIQLGEGEGATWVGVNTAMPNRIVKLALERHIIPLETYSHIRFEVPYGKDRKSRVDFLLTDKETTTSIYVEVKSTTWGQGNLVLFPDTVTTRGQKHLRELTDLLPGDRAVMLYFINRGDCTHFAPGDSADPVYGRLLREAIDQGLEVLPCRFNITPEGIQYLGLATLQL